MENEKNYLLGIFKVISGNLKEFFEFYFLERLREIL